MNDNASKSTFVVRGTVRDAGGKPVFDIEIQAFDQDLPSLNRDQLLGDARTAADGTYEIGYAAQQFARAEKGGADLLVRAVGKRGTVLAEAELFNAPAQALVDLVVQQAGGPSEFERLTAEVRPLIVHLPIDALSGKDVDFLAKETGVEARFIEFFVTAHRHSLRGRPPVDPAAFYGLMREGVPAELPALLVQAPAVLRRALAGAVKDGTIPARFASSIEEVLAQLKALAIGLALTPDAPLSAVLATALPDHAQQQQFLTAYANHQGSVEDFWAALRRDDDLKDRVDALQFSLGASVISANYAPLVRALARKRQAGESRALVDLARYGERDWHALLVQPGADGPIGAPAGVPGKDAEERAANYARVLAHRLEDAFPMAFLQHRLRADDLDGKDDVLAFLAASPDFDLRSTRIDSYIGGKPAVNKLADPDRTKTLLKRMQRVYRIAPRYAPMSALLKQQIGSGQDIARLGKKQFVARFADSFGGAGAAGRAYETARQTEATVLSTFVNHAPLVGRRGMRAVPDTPVAEVDGVPEWRTLFGSVELCECEHCRSVYSPAAYFVDLLHFLADRRVLPVLSARRPDLQDIELTCENSNTPLPYIDLVNEILEDAASPPRPFAPFSLDGGLADDLTRRTPSERLRAVFSPALSPGAVITPGAQAGAWHTDGAWWSIDDTNWTYAVHRLADGTAQVASRGRQTKGTAEERAAVPQYLNRATYDALLSRQVYPWSLPFELGAEEVGLVLADLGATRCELMETFLPGERVAILGLRPVARADLGIGLKESEIIGARAIDSGERLQPLWQQWGFTSEAVGGRPWVTQLASRLDALLQRAGIKYLDLLELLQSHVVNPVVGARRPVKVAGPTRDEANTCDTRLLSLAGLDGHAAGRVLQFVRLQRRLGWTVRDLDRVLLAFAPAGPIGGSALEDPDILVRLSHLRRLTVCTGLPLLWVAAWWATPSNPFWSAAYTDPTENSPYAQLLRGATNPIGGGLPEQPGDLSGTLRSAGTVVTAALGVTAGDLARLVAAGVIPDGMDAPLTMQTLTQLHRQAGLARAAGLAIPAYLAMLRLAGVDPFASTADCLIFLEKLAELRSGGITPAEADYLLQHRLAEGDRIAPRPDDVGALLAELRVELQRIQADNSLGGEAPDSSDGAADPTGDLMRRKLGQLDWDPALIDPVFAALNDPAETAATTAAAAAVVARGCKCFVHDYSVPLAGLPASLRFPRDLVNRIYYDGDARDPRLHFRGVMTETERDRLLRLASDASDTHFVTYGDAVRALFDQPNDDAGNSFLTSGAADSDVEQMFLDPPGSRFAAVLRKLLPYLRRTLSERLVVQKLAGAFALDAGLMDGLLRRWAASSDDPTKRAIADFLLPGFIDSNPHAPLTPAVFATQFKTHTRLHKIALLVAHLDLTARQLGWVFGGAGAGWPDLNALPVAASEPAAPLDGLLLLIRSTAVRDALPGGEDTLDKVFGLADASASDAYAQLAALTQWNEDDLRFLAGPRGFSLAWPATLRDVRSVARLQSCVALLQRVGMSAEQCRALCVDRLTAAHGEQVMQAGRAKRGEADWLAAIRPIQDQLRERRRDALVAYLTAPATGAPDSPDANALYGRYLLDVQIAACMATSRLKQAIGSVQLFVQRCLMNLEPGVVADAAADDHWHQWQWMKNYRVWEANRKIFLYPENWLEPELRDDKSPFFRKLETELMQGDLTQERAQDAFTQYLTQLQEVARLEVMATHHQLEHNAYGETLVDVLHVFARTPSDPRVYYYRRRIDGIEWTAWEKIDVEVRGDHLIAVVWQRRLFLFWALFTQKTDGFSPRFSAGNMDTPPPSTFFEIQLACSERKDNRWAAQKLTSTAVRWFYQPSQVSFHTAFAADGSLSIAAVPDTRSEFGPEGETPICFAFRFEAPNADAVIAQVRPPVPKLTDTLRVGMTLMGREPQLYLPAPADTLALANAPEPYTVLGQSDVPGLAAEPFFFASPSFAPAWRANGARAGTIFLVTPKPTRQPSWTGTDLMSGDLGMLDDASVIAYPSEPSGYGRTAYLSFPAGTARSATGLLAAGSEPTGPGTLHAVYFPPRRSEERYRFETFYHPYVSAFTHQLNRDGVQGLMQREVQREPDRFQPRAPGGSAMDPLVFATVYAPDAVERPIVDRRHPVEDVDFEHDGAYALYNWELFVHAPLLIADRLSKNQRFEEAQRWLHTIFNPTDASTGDTPQRYWQTKKFFETTPADYARQQIERLMSLVAAAADPARAAAMTPDDRRALELAQTSVALWRKCPFKPHVVARLRTVAYQKSVVMRYLDNLIAWGDQLFRRDTIEAMNEAAQLYVLAADILGPRPDKVPPRTTVPQQTYRSLAARLDDFSNALTELESLLPAAPYDGTASSGYEPRITLPAAMLYFCIPPNDKLVGYWDTVQDRLFKIRHCMNIEGIVRALPLFEPPINPALLARAAAAGVDLRSVLGDTAAAPPCYRFNVLAARAGELVAEVKALGNALLAALEKGDAEGLALLRAQHEKDLLRAMRDVRLKQVEEARANRAMLDQSRRQATLRYAHYQKLLGNTSAAEPAANSAPAEARAPAGAAIRDEAGLKQTQSEREEQSTLETAHVFQQLAGANDTVSALLHLVPQIKASPWGVGASFGGSNIGHSLGAISSGLRMLATQYFTDAARSARTSHLLLRENDWVLQSNLAGREVTQIDRQIAAADIRADIAQTELDNHDQQIRNADGVDDYLHGKYTNQELYNWMAGQVSGVYFQAYQLAYDTARRAERSFRLEIGVADSSFIRFGYWDSLKKGLMAGEKLGHDLKRMEMAYLDANRRDYEITKSISLVLHNPLALIQLKASGQCVIRLPEELFDVDYPGHYLRRLKSVSMTIPAVVGPYTSINCTLTLLNSRTRLSAAGESDYQERENDPRFAYSLAPLQSITTSHGQNDSGLFELNFRDERYTPFEFGGAISDWRIEMPKENNAFDFDTISDVVLRIQYTARDGGDSLRNAVRERLHLLPWRHATSPQTTALRRLFSLRHEFATEWARFLQSTERQEIRFDTAPDRFPFQLRGRGITVQQFAVLLLPKRGRSLSDLDRYGVAIRPAVEADEVAGGPADSPLIPGVRMYTLSFAPDGVANTAPYQWSLRVGSSDLAARVTADLLEDIIVLCEYEAGAS